MAKRREQDPNYQFTMAANPHSWLLAADSLHDQAMQLASKERKGLIVQTDGHDRVLGRWEESNKAVFLLGGFALENAIKAFLVYEHPQWISNGRLSRNFRSHSLTGLHAQSTLVPYKTRPELRWLLSSRGWSLGLDIHAPYLSRSQFRSWR